MVGLNYLVSFCCAIAFTTATGLGAFFLLRYAAKRFDKIPPTIALLAISIAGLTIASLLGWIFVTFSFGPANPIGQPSNSAFVGQWTPSEKGRQRTTQEDYGLFSRTLIFHADGTFEMNPTPDLPVECKVGVTPSGCSGTGRWRVERFADSGWTIRLTFTQLDGASVDSSVWMRVGNLFPPYELYDYVGDPDNGDIVYLKKSIP